MMIKMKELGLLLNKYIVVGGIPFRGYTGTLSFTGLKVVGGSSSTEEIARIVHDHYDECGGLLLILDAETGLAAEI